MTDKSNNRVKLFTSLQIWYHKHIIHFMFLFIITGLPLFSDWFSWIAYLIGVPFSVYSGNSANSEILYTGLQVCRIIHRLTGVLWIALSIPFVFSMLPKIRRWDITPKKQSNETWGNYIKEELVDTKSVYIDWKYPKRMGKYNILQIVAAWGIIVVCVLMMGTGITLWLQQAVSTETIAIIRLIHSAGFGIIILFLMIHMYLAVHPVNRAGYDAMFGDGTDSQTHARLKHPGLFKERQ